MDLYMHLIHIAFRTSLVQVHQYCLSFRCRAPYILFAMRVTTVNKIPSVFSAAFSFKAQRGVLVSRTRTRTPSASGDIYWSLTCVDIRHMRLWASVDPIRNRIQAQSTPSVLPLAMTNFDSTSKSALAVRLIRGLIQSDIFSNSRLHW
jgi:hypothetical protein